jgi:hypothetical protein
LAFASFRCCATTRSLPEQGGHKPRCVGVAAFGTDERLARQLDEERFAALPVNGEPVVTAALLRDGKIFDTYDGRWFSQAYRVGGE